VGSESLDGFVESVFSKRIMTAFFSLSICIMLTCSFAAKVVSIAGELVVYTVLDTVSFKTSCVYFTVDHAPDVRFFFVKENKVYDIVPLGSRVRHVSRKFLAGFVSYHSFKLQKCEFRLPNAGGIVSVGETLFIRTNLLDKC
jgi:hypothetical protein